MRKDGGWTRSSPERKAVGEGREATARGRAEISPTIEGSEVSGESYLQCGRCAGG